MIGVIGTFVVVTTLLFYIYIVYVVALLQPRTSTSKEVSNGDNTSKPKSKQQ